MKKTFFAFMCAIAFGMGFVSCTNSTTETTGVSSKVIDTVLVNSAVINPVVVDSVVADTVAFDSVVVAE